MDHSRSQRAPGTARSQRGDEAIPRDNLRAVMGELRAYGSSEEGPDPAWGKCKSGRASQRMCMSCDLKGEEGSAG